MGNGSSGDRGRAAPDIRATKRGTQSTWLLSLNGYENDAGGCFVGAQCARGDVMQLRGPYRKLRNVA